MIHLWEGLDLGMTDFEYHHDRTLSIEIIPSQSSRCGVSGYYFIMRGGVEYHTSGATQKGEARRAKQ